MPPRIVRDILVVDHSTLARNMYLLLFAPHNRFRVRFSDEFMSLFKRSKRLRPDLLIVNSNAIAHHDEGDVSFPSPTILILSRDRLDLKARTAGKDNIVLIEKPFYPYDLISVAHRLIAQTQRPVSRGRKRKANA